MLLTPYWLSASEIPASLSNASERVLLAVGSLGFGLHEALRRELTLALEVINSYYSNAMEGNPTRIGDVFAARDGKFLQSPLDRNYQLEHRAHILTAGNMRHALETQPTLNPANTSFLRQLHAWFYEALPESMRFAKTVREEKVLVEPGMIRTQRASVGLFDPPPPEQVADCLEEFAKAYEQPLTGTSALMSLAASHHRFQWIHPFPDGNGRVGRLFSEALAIRYGFDAGGLYSISRGFARHRAQYDQGLSAADAPRRDDLDGRGNLTLRGLVDWTNYFLSVLKDQILFMKNILNVQTLTERFDRQLAVWQVTRYFSKSECRVLRHLFAVGPIARGEISRLTGVARRQVSTIAKHLLAMQVAQTDSPKGKLRLRISADLARALLTEFFDV